MRKIFLAIVFLLFAQMNFAQSVFAPIGSYFSYTFSGFFSNGLQTLYYSNDTIINGQSIKVICRAGYYTMGNPGPPSFYSDCNQFILERNDSVFQYNGMQPLYTFNTNVGDSIVFNDSPGSSSEFRYKIVLDSIGTDTICGIVRDMLYYSKIQDTCPSVSMPVTIARGIGPIDDYLFSQLNCVHSGAHYSLDCINLGNCNYPSANCAGQPFSLKKESTNSFTMVVINNANDIYLKFSEEISGNLIIKDVLGKIVYQAKVQQQGSFSVPAAQFAPGIYFVSVHSNGNTILSKKFIRE